MKMKKVLKIVGIIVLIGFQWSCDDSVELGPDENLLIEQYLTQNGITAETDSNGIYFVRNIENTSAQKIEPTNVVTIYFRLLSLEEVIIDEYLIDDGDPQKFMHGVEAVFPEGLDLGLKLMHEGDNFTFIIPSQYAYGTNNIPAFGIEPYMPVITITRTL